MFALIYWMEEKTISVVEKKDIKKCQNNNIVKVKWGKRLHLGKLIAENGKFILIL